MAMGTCHVTQGIQPSTLWQQEGWDGVGDEREVQKGGHTGVPMADSC